MSPTSREGRSHLLRPLHSTRTHAPSHPVYGLHKFPPGSADDPHSAYPHQASPNRASPSEYSSRHSPPASAPRLRRRCVCGQEFHSWSLELVVRRLFSATHTTDDRYHTGLQGQNSDTEWNADYHQPLSIAITTAMHARFFYSDHQ
jgi:hypothetical protein